ncbi:MmcQ/YjbR family DNA-binding protein [Paenibacillus sp. MBLB4367]|uniref:MmcQ/YjbR family DNA-binding protein n=1 Tax=Paenibacillus sp. MBLB4367 TaxID=3384767 RepID=UPI00390816C4
MNKQELIEYCLTRTGAAEDFPFGPEPSVMKVGGKMFALISSGDVASISLKCDPFEADLLRAQYEAVKPGYHLNKRHWNTVTVDGSVPEQELFAMIDQSYGLVVRSLTKAEREKLGAGAVTVRKRN